jgi:CHAT domain
MASKRNQAAKPGDAGVSTDPKPTSRLDVEIKLVRGGLTNVKAPIVVGARYDGLAFAGPTKIFDHELDSWLTRAVDLGIIGSALGQLMPINLAQFHKADKIHADTLILAGMGEPGRFAQDGVRFIFSNVVVTIKAIAVNEFATPLLGTRRNELPVGDAVRGLVQGICDGYDRALAIADSVTESKDAFQAVVRQPLTVILVHEDAQKLALIQRELQDLAKNTQLPNINLTVVDGGTVDPDPKLEPSPIDDDPDQHITYLRVTQSKSTKAGRVLVRSATAPRRKSKNDGPRATIQSFPTKVFEFSALSDIAVVPQREQWVNAHLLHGLAERMAQTYPPDERQEQCDFFTNLVIPEDFRKLIEGPANVTLEIDDTAAMYPWEMAGYKKFAGAPLFLGTNLAVSRQFRTLLSPPPASPPALNSTLSALIIADPGSGALALPGARREGLAVAAVLQKVQDAWGDQYQIDVTLRMGPQDDPDVQKDLDKATQYKVVASAKACHPLELAMLLVNKQYDLVHYAGHGISDPATGQTGWVFAEDCVLSAKEIFQVRQVPRLVFANACYSAVTTDDTDAQRKHTTGLAQAFFGRGIPNYVGAGWQVDDRCAVECTRWFYARLLGLTGPNEGDGIAASQAGATIGRALQQARQKTQELDPSSSSWGAYQHYGHVGDRLVSIADSAAAPNTTAAQPAQTSAARSAAQTTTAKAAEAKTTQATNAQTTTNQATKAPSADVAASGSPSEDPNFVYVNGIDFNTGQYAVKPRSIADIAKQILRGPKEDFTKTRGYKSRALPAGVSDSLEDAGWGIIFPENTPDAIRAALSPLIEFRRKRAGKLLKDNLEYKSGEQVRDWLARHGVSPGTVMLNRVPYYLLLVGGPDQIPFEFQYLLGIGYAVGRLSFDDPKDYEKYARSTVAYESGKSVPNDKKISYWGTRHLGDGATRLSSTFLLDPLINGMPDDGQPPVSQKVGFGQEFLLAKNATKENLLTALRAPKPPALLFTASHGMVFNAGQAEQAASQGALLCQDWPGFGSMKPEHFLSAADVADDANVNGVVAFLFACFGAGTPDKDQFVDNLSQAGSAPPLAPKPFMAALPRRLLTHPKGSALAVIGHIDRAWNFSMQAPKVATPQIGTFRDSLIETLKGKPIGSTLSTRFGARLAELSADMLSVTSPTASGPKPGDSDLVNDWIERNDAQNYVLLGDPAVRIRSDVLS